MEENYFFDLEQMSFKEKRPGVQLKSITGEKIQLQIVQLEPNFESDHSHDQEQMGMVHYGTVEITINGITQICEKGMGYFIPANVQHSFKVISEESAELFEVFDPPKEENRMENLVSRKSN